jgi:SpoU rRNA methylase family enzyme
MSDDDDESSSGEEGFVVRVRTLMGSELYVFAYLSDTVELLKTRIAFQEGKTKNAQE